LNLLRVCGVVTVWAITLVAVQRGAGCVQAELVSRAQRGDREAFSVLAGAAVDRLHTLARLILRDADLAQDATQDALVRAWLDLPSLRDVDRFDAWLYRVTIRACSNTRRTTKRWVGRLSVVETEATELDRSSDLADRDELEQALRRLTVAQRTIVVLTFYLGYPVVDVADVLDIPVGTAKSRLHYALEALRAALAADARSDPGAATKEQTA
jgi:RNA polymerase sigma-70 factor (ECF subfamily)